MLPEPLQWLSGRKAGRGVRRKEAGGRGGGGVRWGVKIVVGLTSLQFPGTEARQGRENAKRARETHTLTSAQPDSLCYH